VPALHSLHTAIDILTLFGVAGERFHFLFYFSFWQPKTFCVFVVELLWARVQNDRRRGPSALLLFCCVVRRVYKAVPAGT